MGGETERDGGSWRERQGEIEEDGERDAEGDGGRDGERWREGDGVGR